MQMPGIEPGTSDVLSERSTTELTRYSLYFPDSLYYN